MNPSVFYVEISFTPKVFTADRKTFTDSFASLCGGLVDAGYLSSRVEAASRQTAYQGE